MKSYKKIGETALSLAIIITLSSYAYHHSIIGDNDILDSKTENSNIYYINNKDEYQFDVSENEDLNRNNNVNSNDSKLPLQPTRLSKKRHKKYQNKVRNSYNF